MQAGGSKKFIVSGRIPGDDDDTLAEVSVEVDETPVNVFIERFLYDGVIPADWKFRQPNKLENNYGEWACIQYVIELPDDIEKKCGLKESLLGFANIPPHNPARFETIDGLDSPRCTNAMRVAFARTAIKKFQNSSRTNDEWNIAVVDLIGNLLHLVHASGHDPASITRSALEHFFAEAGGVDHF